LTKGPLPKTPGRKRVYASAADRQKAYRDRKRSSQVPTLPQVSDRAPELRAQPETVTENVTVNTDSGPSQLRARLAKMEIERDSWKRCYTSACKSIEALALERDQLRTQAQALQADNQELMHKLDLSETGRDQYRRSFEMSQKREFETRKQCDEKLALAQSRMDRLMDDLQQRELELAAAQSKPKKRNVTKKGQGDLIARLQSIKALLNHSTPEMVKLGRAKLDELIFDFQS
jgi:chromosome segregation ATPase